MNIRRLIRLPRRIGSKFKSQGLILLYHRVATLNTDPQLLSVIPERFAEHLEYLSEHYNPISLSELCNALKAGKIPEKSVVITFDDGYADNLWNAKPLLEKNDIPATVFVTSGYIGSDREFWWDDLERLLLLPEQLPDRLELTVGGRDLKWDLTGDVEGTTGQRSSIISDSWNVTMASDPGPRYTIYRDLHRILNVLPHEQRETILSTITQWAGVSRTGRATHRPLTAGELKQLGKGGLVEIGAHTVTHARLSAQPADMQKEEIVRSKESLEEVLGYVVRNFSYPFGQKEDFNNDCVEIVKRAGFTAACANYGSTLTRSTDPYRLPRAMVRDWDVQAFAARIKEWFDG